jgi:putative phosphoribosyl transferase
MARSLFPDYNQGSGNGPLGGAAAENHGMQLSELPTTTVRIPADEMGADRATLEGDLRVAPGARGLVLFAPGSGSSRRSPRNLRVAEALQDVGFGTLLLSLLSPEEESGFSPRRFDVEFLAQRLRRATRWAGRHSLTAGLPVGYYGASTGAAVTIAAAAAEGPGIRALVTRGGRAELAGTAIHAVRVPTLLIVGGSDETVAALNLEAWAQLPGRKAIEIIPGAGHLFEEPGALDNVAACATRWFGTHLKKETS